MSSNGLHRRDRAPDRRVRGNDEHREVLIDPLELVERGDAVDPRHHDVDNRRVKGHGARQLESFGARRCEAHGVSFARQQRLENFTHDLFVVDEIMPVLDVAIRFLHGHYIRALARSTSAARGNDNVKRVPFPTTLSQ